MSEFNWAELLSGKQFPKRGYVTQSGNVYESLWASRTVASARRQSSVWSLHESRAIPVHINTAGILGVGKRIIRNF